MIAPAVPAFDCSLEALSVRFQEALPRIERHARFYFRHVACPDKKADRIADTVAVAWKWFLRLAARGKDASQFVSTLVALAARAVKSGRRVAGKERANDVLSIATHRKHGFCVESLPTTRPRAGSSVAEALVENTVTPPDEQAAFRIDFPRWHGAYDERDRQIIDDLMVGERVKDVSKKYRISQGRVSQKRRNFYEDWLRFHGESETDIARAGVA